MAGYGTDNGFNEWLTSLGRTLPDGAPAVAVLRERGSIYIDSTYGSRFVGTPVDPLGQTLAWPRSDAAIYDTDIGEDVIPTRVVAASYEAAWIEANSPGSLSVVVNPGKMVKRNKVEGAVEQEYFAPATVTNGTAINASLSSTIEGLLYPLLNPVYQPMVLVV